MKFVHIADMHFDSAFCALAGNEKFAVERRLEQRKALKEVVEYIKQNNIPYFFIAGDLYEQEYIRKSTVEYINSLFKEIPETRIFITPGNHDPYIKNSFYKQYKWNENVHIFTEKLERIETPEADIYGYGFNDFYMNNPYHKIKIENPEKINILITHGNLDSGCDENKEYNPMTKKELQEMGFDYVALGHIHKASYNDYENQRIVYPGSTVSLGFDELGKRGFIVGSLEKNEKINLKFLETSAKTFEEKQLDITEINSQEDLIEKINSMKLDENSYYKIILTGKRNFDFIERKIMDQLENKNILRIKNTTQIKYDIYEIAKQVSLKGIFAKKILEKIENLKNKDSESEEVDTKENEDIQKLLNAFEIGMDILK